MSKERELLREIMGYIASGVVSITSNDLGDAAETLHEIQELLAHPEQEQEQEQEQEPESWIKTNGKEPSDWEDYEYVWTHWISGKISLDEAWGCFMWEEITHWMPASIKEPSKPR